MPWLDLRIREFADLDTAFAYCLQLEPLVAEVELVAPRAVEEQCLAGVRVSQHLRQLAYPLRVTLRVFGSLAGRERPPD
jgi:hypothetical protein